MSSCINYSERNKNPMAFDKLWQRKWIHDNSIALEVVLRFAIKELHTHAHVHSCTQTINRQRISIHFEHVLFISNNKSNKRGSKVKRTHFQSVSAIVCLRARFNCGKFKSFGWFAGWMISVRQLGDNAFGWKIQN